MPFNKEQLKVYYETNKVKLNQQRAERRKLKRLGQIETPNPINQVETLSQVETKGEVETVRLVQVETAERKKEVETDPKVSQPKNKVETKEVKLWSDYYPVKK